MKEKICISIMSIFLCISLLEIMREDEFWKWFLWKFLCLTLYRKCLWTCRNTCTPESKECLLQSEKSSICSLNSPFHRLIKFIYCYWQVIPLPLKMYNFHTISETFQISIGHTAYVSLYVLPITENKAMLKGIQCLKSSPGNFQISRSSSTTLFRNSLQRKSLYLISIDNFLFCKIFPICVWMNLLMNKEVELYT